MSRHHEIPAAPENMVWGYFDATLDPVLEIESGDSVTLTSWMAGGKAQLPEVDPGLIRATSRRSTRCRRARARTS